MLRRRGASLKHRLTPGPLRGDNGRGQRTSPRRDSPTGRTRLDRIGSVHAWSVGDHLTHRFNPELGTGRVIAIEGRVLVVHFPLAGTTLRLAGSNDALVPGAEPARPRDRSPLERLADGDVDETEDVLTRLDILHLLATREAGGL